MRRRYRIYAGVALFALLLFGMWLLFQGSPARRSLSVGFTTASGHFPEPGLVYADRITVLWVTNSGRAPITLDGPYAEFENGAGRLVRDQGSSWNQEGYSVELLPGSAAWLANGFDPDRKRVRFVFDYHRRGGALLRIASKAVGALPVPRRTHDFLRQHGMVDGNLYGHYESPWIDNQTVQRTGASRSAQETNRTSSTAGSRR